MSRPTLGGNETSPQSLLPDTSTVPESGRTRPHTTRIAMVLPDPFSPSRHATSPEPTEKLTESSTCSGPIFLQTSRTST